jgi:hypothetical protein
MEDQQLPSIEEALSYEKALKKKGTGLSLNMDVAAKRGAKALLKKGAKQPDKKWLTFIANGNMDAFRKEARASRQNDREAERAFMAAFRAGKKLAEALSYTSFYKGAKSKRGRSKWLDKGPEFQAKWDKFYKYFSTMSPKQDRIFSQAAARVVKHPAFIPGRIKGKKELMVALNALAAGPETWWRWLSDLAMDVGRSKAGMIGDRVWGPWLLDVANRAKALREDSPLEAPISGFNRHQKLMSPAPRSKRSRRIAGSTPA